MSAIGRFHCIPINKKLSGRKNGHMPYTIILRGWILKHVYIWGGWPCIAIAASSLSRSISVLSQSQLWIRLIQEEICFASMFPTGITQSLEMCRVSRVKRNISVLLWNSFYRQWIIFLPHAKLSSFNPLTIEVYCYKFNLYSRLKQSFISANV